MEKITLTIKNHTGSALVGWDEDHYEAFVTIPYQDSRWISLFIYDEASLDKALDKALQELKLALLRCGMC